jgi:HNH endonuclease
MFVPGRRRYDEDEVREAMAASASWAESLRRLGLRPAGGNFRSLQRFAERAGIASDHFDPMAGRIAALRAANRPMRLEDILVRGSIYNRGHLKRRLYREGVKQRVCELCGQGEDWRGRRMSLILDHINGEATDNRLENLQIICPNCAATLDTHCGKGRHGPRTARQCPGCDALFVSENRGKRYCSHECFARTLSGVPRPNRRLVDRPPLAQLLAEIEASSWSAVGRKYGVSDNAIRKWVRQYEREAVADDA